MKSESLDQKYHFSTLRFGLGLDGGKLRLFQKCGHRWAGKLPGSYSFALKKNIDRTFHPKKYKKLLHPLPPAKTFIRSCTSQIGIGVASIEELL